MHRKASMTKPGARVKTKKGMAYYVARPSGVVREFPMPGGRKRRKGKRVHHRRRHQTERQRRASMKNLHKAWAKNRKRSRRRGRR